MDFVTLHEVGPRDGLQNEARVIPVAEKVALIEALAGAGLPRIEVGSFVSPKWVPQMAGTDAVMAALSPGPVYEVLVPNMRGWQGFQAAKRHGEYAIAVFVAATEGFSRANLNCSVAESLERAAPVIAAAQEEGVAVRGYVSCVTDCPYEGQVPPGQVAQVLHGLRALGVGEVSLGDTIGKGTPERVGQMLDAALGEVPAAELAGHFHDTGGQALQNIVVSLEKGLRSFDAAAGGLGGCPYAPGAPGNVATEAVVAMLHDAGFETGVDAGKLGDAAGMARAMRGCDDAGQG
ncbi:hydroxymethylglutaryl-CoA lyase [Yoonia sp. R2331]|uniref:hydroxymethylglutaryl-CoA lyase n=1 Tax=Yoonia sp. R2331 TaxID=3237238 RepID=UPI0034E41607